MTSLDVVTNALKRNCYSKYVPSSITGTIVTTIIIYFLFVQYLSKGQVSPEDATWCEMQTAPAATAGRMSSLCQLCAPCSQRMDQLRLLWHLYIFKYACRLAAVISAFASAIILWSEIANPTHLQSPIGQLLVASTRRSDLSMQGSSYLAQSIIFIFLSYMSVCTYWSLFRLNIGWAYTMQGPHLSPPSSLLFNGTYFCRLQFYIGYNFILFLNVKQ